MPLLKVVSKNALLGLQCLPHPLKIEAGLHQSPIIITNNCCLVWSAQFVANNKSPCLLVTNYAIECCRLYIKRKVHIGTTAKQLFLYNFSINVIIDVDLQNTMFVTLSW